MQKITVVGMGYVGLSNALVLSQCHRVIAFDINKEKINQLKTGQLPITSPQMVDFLGTQSLCLDATSDKQYAYQYADVIIIATPTDYDSLTNFFNTDSVESVIKDVIYINPRALIVIKSTVPVGFTKKIRAKYGVDNIIFSPEFLREDKALYDNLYPSRIIVGEQSERAGMIANMLLDCTVHKDAKILLTDSTEAEAIKLFSNTYLALRVAYFNELDTFASTHELNAAQIIRGVSLDPRIGDYYNNPSFGYGGYCLPKDTRQLLANYQDIPQNLIGAVVSANSTRKLFIAREILKRQPKIVGIYRLTMKAGSDNFRDAAILDIINHLIEKKVEIWIYEPSLSNIDNDDVRLVENLAVFKSNTDLIVANRMADELKDVKAKVYTRDIFGEG
ncbi:nucleotide sugar dehydrogenase [Moraxella canis]|uniref:UDP-glucose 6-dehydrogenase n=1 Tax=Moraxella canis TaxID=90239 RepID=A0ABZ0WZX7_9GAMM|nr:nucleotide sugar dehydrogenase [Moraxella canis]WQE04819.1 nucleotide sugar dehydrogenase [Moraxella canis]